MVWENESYWKHTSDRADAWKQIAQVFFANDVRFGVKDPHNRPFVSGRGRIFKEFPHTEENRLFVDKALEEGIADESLRRLVEKKRNGWWIQKGCT